MSTTAQGIKEHYEDEHFLIRTANGIVRTKCVRENREGVDTIRPFKLKRKLIQGLS